MYLTVFKVFSVQDFWSIVDTESIVFMEMYLCRFTPKRRFLFMGKIRREGKIY